MIQVILILYISSAICFSFIYQLCTQLFDLIYLKNAVMPPKNVNTSYVKYPKKYQRHVSQLREACVNLKTDCSRAKDMREMRAVTGKRPYQRRVLLKQNLRNSLKKVNQGTYAGRHVHASQFRFVFRGGLIYAR